MNRTEVHSIHLLHNIIKSEVYCRKMDVKLNKMKYINQRIAGHNLRIIATNPSFLFSSLVARIESVAIHIKEWL